jgi:hypothetical protein
MGVPVHSPAAAVPLPPPQLQQQPSLHLQQQPQQQQPQQGYAAASAASPSRVQAGGYLQPPSPVSPAVGPEGEAPDFTVSACCELPHAIGLLMHASP